jgi:hypothetical protein
LPPAWPTAFIAELMSSTAITIEGYCAGQSGFFSKNPPPIAPAGQGGEVRLTALLVW